MSVWLPRKGQAKLHKTLVSLSAIEYADALLSNIQYTVNLRNLDRNTHEYFYAFVSNPGTSV